MGSGEPSPCEGACADLSGVCRYGSVRSLGTQPPHMFSRDSDARHRLWTPPRHTQALHPHGGKSDQTPQEGCRAPGPRERRSPAANPGQDASSPSLTHSAPRTEPGGCPSQSPPVTPLAATHGHAGRSRCCLVQGPHHVPDIPDGPGQMPSGLVGGTTQAPSLRVSICRGGACPARAPHEPDGCTHSPRQRPAAATAAGSSVPWGRHAPRQQTPGASVWRVKPAATQGFHGRPADPASAGPWMQPGGVCARKVRAGA